MPGLTIDLRRVVLRSLVPARINETSSRTELWQASCLRLRRNQRYSPDHMYARRESKRAKESPTIHGQLGKIGVAEMMWHASGPVFETPATWRSSA